PKVTGSDYCLFNSKIKAQYNLNNNRLLPYFLGFKDPNNIAFLQSIILEHYPSIFKSKSLTKTKELMHRTLLKQGEQLDNKFDELIRETSDNLIKHNILLEKEAKILLPKSTQLEGKLEKITTGFDEKELLEKSIDDTIKSAQLGSTILISTKQYLSLYTICNTIFEHTNEEQEVQLAKAVAASGLVGGISRNALQSSLAMIGITKQISNKTYYHYQKMDFDPLIDCTKYSAEKALKRYINHTLLQHKNALAVDYFHKPVIAFHVVEKTRFKKDKKSGLTKTIHQGNFDKTSRQMKNAILIEVLNKITPLLEEAELHLEICIDSDLDLNKTLAAAFQRAAQDHDALTKAETREMQIEGLINHLQNNHSGCWPEICWTKDDPEIILQEPTLHDSPESQINEFRKLLETIFRIPHGQGIVTFSQTSQNEAFNQELVYYKKKALDRLHDNEFCPFFALSITDFDVIVRCVCYHSFLKQSKGLCILCHMYQIFSWNERLIDSNIIQDKVFKPMSLEQRQIEAIRHYMEEEKDTLVIIKTGGGKSFCYTASAILFDRLIIVISPLKLLIQNQMNCFVQSGIPCGALLTSSQGTIKYESRLFEKIALGFTHLLFVTLEKLLLNKLLRTLCKHLYKDNKLLFVIDEVHCILDFCYFRKAWGKLGTLKEFLSNVRIIALIATLSQSDVEDIRNNLNIEETCFRIVRGKTDRAIIYCASANNCSDILDTLIPKMGGISIDEYNAFGLGIDMPNIRLVLLYNFLMSMTGRDQQKYECIVLYSKKGIHTNYAIIADNQESNEDNDKQTTQRESYLAEAQLKLFEVIYYYPISPVCNSCNNCIKRENDDPIQVDVKAEILKLLEVVTKLDLKDLSNHPKPKYLCTKALAELALADLVHHGFVRQTIWLERKANIGYLTYSLVIEGIAENAALLAQGETWLYWIKK
ncbi:44450_t:CDS:10, partial [Gigaspora margarita]